MKKGIELLSKVQVENMAVKDEFTCPMSRALFIEPVVAFDGFTYEKAMIERWLIDHNTSPKTNQTLASKFIIDNHNLRQVIRRSIETDDGLSLYEQDHNGRKFNLLRAPCLRLVGTGPDGCEWTDRDFPVMPMGVKAGRGDIDVGGGLFDLKAEVMKFTDSTVSRRHFEIDFEVNPFHAYFDESAQEEKGAESSSNSSGSRKGVYVLRDSGSAAGTLFRLDYGKKYPLNLGSTFSIGKHTFQVVPRFIYDEEEGEEQEQEQDTPASRATNELYASEFSHLQLSDHSSSPSSSSFLGTTPPREVVNMGQHLADLPFPLSNMPLPPPSGDGQGDDELEHLPQPPPASTPVHSSRELKEDMFIAPSASLDVRDLLEEEAKEAERGSEEKPAFSPHALWYWWFWTQGSPSQRARLPPLPQGPLALRCVGPTGSPLEGLEFDLERGEPFWMGRRDGSNVPFYAEDDAGKASPIDTSVSGNHCVVQFDEELGGFVLSDGGRERGSTNGTWIRLLTKPRKRHRDAPYLQARYGGGMEEEEMREEAEQRLAELESGLVHPLRGGQDMLIGIMKFAVREFETVLEDEL